MAAALVRLSLALAWIERWAALPAVLAGTFLLRLKNIGQAVLGLDEACHAIVAKSLLADPFLPILYRTPAVPCDPLRWTEATVWLHKPILPLWTIAASYRAFGATDTFALRFPSVVLATAAVALTYFIGCELFNRRAALAAAVMQAIAPVFQAVVRGDLFSDHIDVALLCWTELAVYFLVRAWKSGRTRDALWAGAAAGAAYLSKYFLGLLVPGLAVGLWFARRRGWWGGERAGLRGGQVGALFGGLFAVAGPWLLSCLWRFPTLIIHEHGYALAHLAEAKERWDAPWDRLVFDYLPLLHGFFFTTVAAATVFAGIRVWSARTSALAFLLGWQGLVLLPHILAATKTPTATLILTPAGFLLAGWLLSEIIEGRLGAVIAGAAAARASLLVWQPRPVVRRGAAETPGFAGVLREHWWIAEQCLVAAVVALVLWLLARWWRRRGARPRGWWVAVGTILVVLGTCGMIFQGRQSYRESLGVAAYRPPDASFRRTGAWIQEHLPASAVVLVDRTAVGEQLRVMFWSARDCHPLRQQRPGNLAALVRQAGRHPYLLSATAQPYPLVFQDETDGRALYDLAAAGPESRPK